MKGNNAGLNVKVNAIMEDLEDKTWEEIVEIARKFNEEQARLYEERMLKEQQEKE